MSSEDIGQLGDGQLGDFPLGGSLLSPPAPRDLVITFQMDFVCTPAIGALGAFSQTMQMSSAYTYYVDARITQHRLVIASSTVYDSKIRLTQHRLVIAQKYYPFKCQINMSSTFTPEVLVGGRIQVVMRMAATYFTGSGTILGNILALLQLSVNFYGSGAFAGMLSVPLQLSTIFTGLGNFVGEVVCTLQMSVYIIGPEVPAGVNSVVGDSVSSPPPTADTGSYVN